ncbi:MAG: proline--tRNA ligase [Phycisphaerales bacterium]|jgi:prolyl-tRNA synthetase|nr:proline--tRNA ligase [Phycisphaerales bacterium]
MNAGQTSTKRAISNTRTGDSHLWSRTLIPTTREAPADAETPSHVLLSRAGFIRKVAAGVYDYLPLAWRVLTKVSNIVRDEMNNAGSVELFMPVIVPMEFYQETKRHEAYGDLLFKVTDRKGNTAALGPTHEETITEMVKGSVNSYKQLPLSLYQIQTKFRDEARPRAGLLRCREFIMKDAYTFHTKLEGPGGLNEAYDAMYRAYSNIFSRCGLDYTAVEAESGPIGGSASHEFMINCASGEDTILKCPVSGYAANVEKCEIGERPRGSFAEPPTGELTEVHTPNLPGIDEVGKFMKVKPDRMLKTIVFKVIGLSGVKQDIFYADRNNPNDVINQPEYEARLDNAPGWIIAVVRGDHDVNEGKVKAISGYNVALADDKAARAAGFAIGYVSPRTVNAVPGTLLLIDSDASMGGFWASGSDKPDHHVKHFNWRREVGAILDDPARVKVGDVRNAMEGDPSPRAAGAKLVTARGIEVGHIFKLGTKYSDAMGLAVLDETQQKRSVIMGCYGIGVSRTMAACVEMSHDENGIIWPAAIAPYHVLITLMKPDDPRQREAAGKIACELVGHGVDVLTDDRDERPGPKFKDADLVGIPIRVTIGDKALEQGGVEFKARKDASKGQVVPLADVVQTCLNTLNA